MPCLTFIAVLLIGANCAENPPLVVTTNVPMIYLTLTTDSVTQFQPDLRALVANTGAPTRVEYRTAERFIMRRESDGAVFDWREDSVRHGDYIPNQGNYVLAESSSTRGLGRRDLLPGESYTLEVVVDGHTVKGRATIPELPRAVLVQRSDGAREVEWARIPGVGEYVLYVQSDFAHDHTTTDTFYVLHDDLSSTPGSSPLPFEITATDTNWTRYMSDSTVTAAGLEGAYGLYGAKSTSVLEIPPKSASSSSSARIRALPSQQF